YDIALSLDPGYFRFRSCAITFNLSGQYDRALNYIALDAGSEWNLLVLPEILIRQGKTAEALQLLQRSGKGSMLRACLEKRPRSEVISLAAKEETTNIPDPEPLYHMGSVEAFCGLNESALRLLEMAVHGNYCAYPAMDSDPLLAGLRTTGEFQKISAAAIDCQKKFLEHCSGVAQVAH